MEFHSYRAGALFLSKSELRSFLKKLGKMQREHSTTEEYKIRKNLKSGTQRIDNCLFLHYDLGALLFIKGGQINIEGNNWRG